MNAKLIELAERRTVLVARAATQRAELAQILAPWRRPLTVVDQGVWVVRYLKSYGWLLVGVGVFVAFRPWRGARWLRRGFVVWRLALVVKRILPGLGVAFKAFRFFSPAATKANQKNERQALPSSTLRE